MKLPDALCVNVLTVISQFVIFTVFDVFFYYKGHRAHLQRRARKSRRYRPIHIYKNKFSLSWQWRWAKIWMAPLNQSSPLWPILWENSPIFITVATTVGPGNTCIWMALLNRPSPKTTCLVRTWQLWHSYKPSYGRFCAKIGQFLLPLQQRSAQRIFEWHH